MPACTVPLRPGAHSLRPVADRIARILDAADRFSATHDPCDLAAIVTSGQLLPRLSTADVLELSGMLWMVGASA